MDAYYREYRASIHRGVYPLAARATEAFEGARAAAARLVGSTPGETIFTRNATEAINLVAYSWGAANVGAGDLIVLTEMEHHSNIVPWQMLAQRAGARIEYVAITDDGHAGPRRARRAARARPEARRRRARLQRASPRSTRSPRSSRRAHAAGAVVLVDGTQAVPHMPVDLAEIDADFYAWTAHKAYGPTGIGLLHGRRSLLEAMPPFIGGGHMIARVGEQSSTYAEPPAKFEAGTGPIAEAVGLGAAVGFFEEIGMDAVRAHDIEIGGYALDALADVPGIRIHGPADAVRARRARVVRARGRAPARRRRDPRLATASACAPATTARSR